MTPLGTAEVRMTLHFNTGVVKESTTEETETRLDGEAGHAAEGLVLLSLSLSLKVIYYFKFCVLCVSMGMRMQVLMEVKVGSP